MYLFWLWFEKIANLGVRLASLPTLLRFQAIKPDQRRLSYPEMLEMDRRYPPKPVPGATYETSQQKKWAMRVVQLAKTFHLQNILEVGCGHGVASLFTANAGFRVAATDIVDGRYPEVRSSSVQFSIGDACTQLPYADHTFDLVYSINAMEHFPDPQAALSEILRVTCPGGILFFAFSPLYYSPWGLHANRRLGMPYPQLLFSEETIQRFVDENQANIAHTYDISSDKSKIGPYLNGYSIDQYRQLFKKYSQKLKVWACVESISLEGSHMIKRYAEILKLIRRRLMTSLSVG